jgi:hypothetical protein
MPLGFRSQRGGLPLCPQQRVLGCLKVRLSRRLGGQLRPTLRSTLLLDPCPVGCGSRHRQFGLGHVECRESTSSGIPVRAAFSLRTRLRIVHALGGGEEHDGSSRNQNSPPEESLYAPSGPPSRLGSGWDQRGGHCDRRRCNDKVAHGAFELVRKLECAVAPEPSTAQPENR